MIIGFGSIETDRENKFYDDLRLAAAQLAQSHGDTYFSPQLAYKIICWAEAKAAEFEQSYQHYKTSDEHPDRYSSVVVHYLSDASYFVVVARWLHINRRHGLSPDGWACMANRRVYLLDTDDLTATAAA